MARGGKREGAGRKPGAPNKLTTEQNATLTELARQHTATALDTLVRIAKTGQSEAAQVSAANSILDRAYGKPVQSVEHSGPNGAPMQNVNLSAEEFEERARRVAQEF